MPKGMCAFCQKSLKEEALIAMNKLWHPDHFVCTKCQKPIRHEFKRDENDSPLCIICCPDSQTLNCDGCGEPLRGIYLAVEEKKWHKECFVCSICKQPFPKGDYLILEGFAYDSHCFMDKYIELGLAKMAENQMREVQE